MRKKYIINRMQSLIDTSRGKIINDTQIRKYASMASQADCKEEFFLTIYIIKLVEHQVNEKKLFEKCFRRNNKNGK